MRWSSTPLRDKKAGKAIWRRWFALYPVEIGYKVVWLEWIERSFYLNGGRWKPTYRWLTTTDSP